MEDHSLPSKEVFEAIQFILTPKVILGALRSAIHAHGPVPGMGIGLTDNKLLVVSKDKEGNWIINEMDICGAPSAAKRIRGALKTRVEEYFRRIAEKESLTDSDSVV
jgi:hypothetical protein